MSSIWGDIKHAAESIPGVGTAVAAPSALGSLVQGHFGQAANDLLRGIPVVGTAMGLSSLAGLIGQAGGGMGGGSSSNSTVNSLLNAIKGYDVNQEYGPQAATTAKSLAAELGNLPASDYSKVMQQLPSGSVLATDIANDLNPQATQTSPYGFDPLSLGQIFSQTLAPWLSTQEKASNAGVNSDLAAMQANLKNLSPQEQQAYAAAIPSLKAAQAGENQAVTSAVATAPEFDSLVQNLTDAINGAKLAQAAAQAEPYWAATTTGTAPNAAPGSAAANASNLVSTTAAQALQNALAQNH